MRTASRAVLAVALLVPCYVLIAQARLGRETVRADEARAAVGRLLDEHPDSVWRDEAAVDRGRFALGADDAAAWFARATSARDGGTAGAARLGVAPNELALRHARTRVREGRGAEARQSLAPRLQEGHRPCAEPALVEARSWRKAALAEAAAA